MHPVLVTNRLQNAADGWVKMENYGKNLFLFQLVSRLVKLIVQITLALTFQLVRHRPIEKRLAAY